MIHHTPREQLSRPDGDRRHASAWGEPGSPMEECFPGDLNGCHKSDGPTCYPSTEEQASPLLSAYNRYAYPCSSTASIVGPS